MACSNMIPLFIINYNGLENLGSRFIDVVERAVVTSTHIDSLRVVLVDNGSRDGSFDVIREMFYDTVMPLKLRSNLGHSMGVNVALKMYSDTAGCTPRYAFVMDNDYAITNPEGLRDLVEHAMRDPRAVAVQGVNLKPDGRVSDAGALITTFLKPVFRCDNLIVDECPEKQSYVSYVISCLALYNVRVILSKRKLIFNRYNIIYHDDVDLSLEMWSYGYTSKFIPTVVGVHYGSSTRKRIDKAFINYERRRGRVLLNRRFSRYVKAVSLLAPYIKSILLALPQVGSPDPVRIRTRALIDALRLKVEQFKGPYEPLLVKPTIKAYPYHYGTSRLATRILKLLETLVVDRSTLLNSRRPFIVSLSSSS
jgi:Predicted glycosyltransferases